MGELDLWWGRGSLESLNRFVVLVLHGSLDGLTFIGGLGSLGGCAVVNLHG